MDEPGCKPDGQNIVFDLMGDLLHDAYDWRTGHPANKGLAYDVHPRYSPDGKKILFISDRSGGDNVVFRPGEERHCSVNKRQ